ncbi:hypothetical protein [Paraburkholderia sp. CI3]|uniref:hypothetical protein n=1 Tax=Paraburkholderia sp. CI3 TaxID=2991060 RepID=UPI003D237111
MDLPDTSRQAPSAIGTFDLNAPTHAQISLQSLSLPLHPHAPMPPEVDPDIAPNTPPPKIDPDPIPDDPVDVPHEPPEGDPPAAPPPQHAWRRHAALARRRAHRRDRNQEFGHAGQNDLHADA